MKFISWNVNGLRACLKKGFVDSVLALDADFICLQETKMEQGQADVPLGEGVLEFWNSAEKKGYSGTAIFTPHPPVAAACGMDGLDGFICRALGFQVKGDDARACPCKGLDIVQRAANHEMDVKKGVRQGLVQALQHRHAHREVGHKMAVHHINVDETRPRLRHRCDVIA